jgi:HK97 gp10 family phage protein
MPDLDFKDLDKLIENIRRIEKKSSKIKEVSLKKSGDLIKKSMERNVPRSNLNKRHLADNIRVSDVEKNNGVDIVKFSPESDFDYWIYTEYGTSNIPAQHWAEKSVLQNKKKVKRIVEDELKRSLE